ncbi:MAG: metallophosphoesterase [Wenzhouxiangellaceae bacterium]|nr:metallophosphoesterase [Wenzhouxiangellaceae bacterium]
MRLIHLTDPHLTPLDGLWPDRAKGALSWLSWTLKRRHRHLRPRLDRLVRALERLEPDAWAITGDLCQTGRAAEIEVGGIWLERLAPPEQVLLVPGNHDIFDRRSEAGVRARWQQFLHLATIDGQWPVVRRLGPVSLIALNSAIVTTLGSAQGELGSAQLKRLDQVLGQEHGRCRVLLIHHPVETALCKPRKQLRDAEALRELLSRHEPALLLHGHLHRNHSGSIGTTSVFGTASASAAGELGAACARSICIEAIDAGFLVRMDLHALDNLQRLHIVEQHSWISHG